MIRIISCVYRSLTRRLNRQTGQTSSSVLLRLQRGCAHVEVYHGMQQDRGVASPITGLPGPTDVPAPVVNEGIPALPPASDLQMRQILQRIAERRLLRQTAGDLASRFLLQARPAADS
jgi:hypothetical protein